MDNTEHWIRHGRSQMVAGNSLQAIEAFKRVLTEDPEDALVHALLALCLLHTKRLHAAGLESNLALTLSPDLPMCHYAAGIVATARRDFVKAQSHLSLLLELEPEDGENYRALARLYAVWGKHEEVLPLLEKAQRRDPEDTDTLTALGDYYLQRGELDRARQYAQQALELLPEQQDALVLMGSIYLRQGNLEEARKHAIWALRIDPSDRSTLLLFASVKARGNWFLGLWWRYSAWLGEVGEGRAIILLLVGFVLYRVATQLLKDTGHSDVAGVVQVLWLGLCVYTWVGPGIFRRALEKEIAQVQLSRDF